MNMKIKRAVSLCTAVALTAVMAGCASSDSASSTADSTAATTTRKVVTTAPVVETLGDLDLSDVQTESNVPDDFRMELEAETGTTSGTSAKVLTQNFMGAYSGDGFVSLLTKDDTVEFDVNMEYEGSYNITLTCAADKSNVTNLITVDGASLTSFTTSNDSFGDEVAENVLIPSGEHTIGIKASDGQCYVDKIVITAAEQIDLSQYEVTASLCNPNASEETQRLYNFLTDVYGKYIISGQYSGDNLGSESREFIEIERNTGKVPAILGLDLIESSPSRIAHESGGGEMVPLQAMEWWNNGGIVSLCWHWNAPEPYLEKNGGAWWEGFYSEYTDFDLAAALDGSDPEGYDYLIRDIDAIAEILIELDDYHVPILWRPLHEGGGDPEWKNPWFWWGSSGAEAYIELWQLMYDRFTNVHHINNLIWVWNGQDPDYYPGDEYVDIIGYDVYADEGDMSSKKEYYDLMKSVTSENKIIAMTENGSLFDPDAAFADGSRWAWFSTWNGEFTLKDAQLSSQYTPLEMWNKIYNSERVLTLDELPDLKNYPLATERYLEENGGGDETEDGDDS